MAQSYNNIGAVYADQRNYPLALEYYEKALEIWKSVLGEKHPDAALSYNNIGYCYSNQGNYPLAMEYYEKALEIWESIFGEVHHHVANIYFNIAYDYIAQGNYSSALTFCKKALKIFQSIYGEKDMNVVVIYYSIGNIYTKQENYPSALEYYKKALNILTHFEKKTDTLQTAIDNAYSSFLAQDILTTQKNEIKTKDFISHILFEIEIIEGDFPAFKRGLTGNYYLLKYNDWDMESIENLYIYNGSIQGKPKTLLLLKDGVITEQSFDDQIGIYLHVKWVEKDEREKVLRIYHDWIKKQ